MMSLANLSVKIYADGADRDDLVLLHDDPLIHGITTNPTLMRKAGIKDYEAFARDVLLTVRHKPISLEVFSDEFSEMRRQALKIASWGTNVFVKIPICNTRGDSSLPLIAELSKEAVQMNVTAMLTVQQVRETAACVQAAVPCIYSVFAGRIADAGCDPEPMMREAVEVLKPLPSAQLLWASVREIYNIFQADRCGCHIVTVPHPILKKALTMVGRDLMEICLDTVQMFEGDARAAGYTL